jgi:ATP-dependent DNA helicase RecG
LEEQVTGTVGFIRRNLSVGYRIEKAGPREEVPEIPEAVYREALLNALTHRDYFSDTTHVYVHMHPGRVEISNPGGRPHGSSLEELGTRAVPRHRLIADMFYRIGYVERLGSWIYRMRSAMAAEHLPAPRFIPTENAFRVQLLSSFPAAGLSEEESEICQWLSQKGRATSRELQDAFRLAKATMHRRLASLIKDGWIKAHGSGRGTFHTIDYGQEIVEPK